MRKVLSLVLLFAFCGVLTSACTNNAKPKQNLIQSKRRFAEYVEPQQQRDPNRVDLSEGPKLRYDANLGPKNLNFDIKIVDPY